VPSGMIFIPSFMKMHKLVTILYEKQTYRYDRTINVTCLITSWKKAENKLRDFWCQADSEQSYPRNSRMTTGVSKSRNDLLTSSYK
jgi:hypothetical protein